MTHSDIFPDGIPREWNVNNSPQLRHLKLVEKSYDFSVFAAFCTFDQYPQCEASRTGPAAAAGSSQQLLAVKQLLSYLTAAVPPKKIRALSFGFQKYLTQNGHCLKFIAHALLFIQIRRVTLIPRHCFVSIHSHTSNIQDQTYCCFLDIFQKFKISLFE